VEYRSNSLGVKQNPTAGCCGDNWLAKNEDPYMAELGRLQMPRQRIVGLILPGDREMVEIRVEVALGPICFLKNQAVKLSGY
jgi:hypothetical protein